MSEKTPPKPSGDGAIQRHRREAAPVKLNPTFDTWLETKLHQIFDVASTEPLPMDLVNLLEKIDQAEADKTPESALERKAKK